jgi:PAS domain S-box-containing protein
MSSTDILRTIFDHVSFPVLLIDRDYQIVEANRAALSHVCRRGVDAIGRSCFEVTHALKNPCWHSEDIKCPVKEAFEMRKRVHAIHRHQIKDDLFIEEIIATPLDEVTGEVNYVIEEFRDITELLELREGILPICASCKKIRNVQGTWYRVEEYIHDHTGADFSHSLCPECFRRQLPE